MNIILAIAVASALVLPSHHLEVPFDGEIVTLKFSNVPSSPDQEALQEAINGAKDPVEQERLTRMKWEDYGDSLAFYNLAAYHLERGDLVSGYAHLYGAEKIAEWSTSVSMRKPGPILMWWHSEIAADLAQVASAMTPSQRKAGAKMAAQLIRNNPNCCTAL